MKNKYFFNRMSIEILELLGKIDPAQREIEQMEQKLQQAFARSQGSL